MLRGCCEDVTRKLLSWNLALFHCARRRSLSRAAIATVGKILCVGCHGCCTECCYHYFAYGRGAKCCDQYVRSAVCLSVCLFVYFLISKITQPNSTNFCACCHVAVARASSGDVAIRYVLPVSWMTTYFHIMGFMERRVYSYNSTTVSPRSKVTLEHQ